MIATRNQGVCELCGKEAAERCNDGVCRACHKSLTFDECISGEWERLRRREAGLPIREEDHT